MEKTVEQYYDLIKNKPKQVIKCDNIKQKSDNNVFGKRWVPTCCDMKIENGLTLTENNIFYIEIFINEIYENGYIFPFGETPMTWNIPEIFQMIMYQNDKMIGVVECRVKNNLPLTIFISGYKLFFPLKKDKIKISQAFKNVVS